ncbi:hypothetical protein CHI14_14730 [Paenibacillus sp. 7516]|nr:hypothetical protein CHI14_14730 [Paenibacillus sp. 7516]
MKDQRGMNLGIIRISYILGIMAFLSMFLFTVLSITFSILSLISSFIAVAYYRNRRSVNVLIFNVVVFTVIILVLYFIISNFVILE